MTIPSNVLVLCHGNVNRSPLCQYLLQESLGREVRSAGVKPDARGPASRKLRRWAAARWEHLSHDKRMWKLYERVTSLLEQHRARPLTDDLLLWADCIVLMDNGNLTRLLHHMVDPALRSHLSPEPSVPSGWLWRGEPIKMLGAWHNPPLPRIPDPVFMKAGSDEAHRAYLACEQATLRMVEIAA